MKKILVKIFIVLVVIGALGIGTNVLYKVSKKGVKHLLENIIKSRISYDTYEFNPFSYVRFVNFKSKSMSADTLEVDFDIVDLLYKKIALIRAVNLYFNLDTLVAAYIKGKDGGGKIPDFEISKVVWYKAELIAGGVDFKMYYMLGGFKGISNSLVIPFKATRISFLNNEYRFLSSTVRVFKDSTVLGNVTALSDKIVVRGGRLKIPGKNLLLWRAKYFRYEQTVLKNARGSINGKTYEIIAGRSKVVGKYNVDSLRVVLSTENFDTLNLHEFTFFKGQSSIRGKGSVKNLTFGVTDSINYAVNLKVSNYKRENFGFSGIISLRGKGKIGSFDAYLRNVFYKKYNFRQLNLMCDYDKNSLYIYNGELIDPNLNIIFNGYVSKDSTRLSLSGNGYDIYTYAPRPVRTRFFNLAGSIYLRNDYKEVNLVAEVKSFRYEDIESPYLRADISYKGGNLDVKLMGEKFSVGKIVFDSTALDLSLSPYHMGKYQLSTNFGKDWIKTQGEFYLDSSGVYIENRSFTYRLDSLIEKTENPIFLNIFDHSLELYGDSINLFEGQMTGVYLRYSGDSVDARARFNCIDLSYLYRLFGKSTIEEGKLSGVLDLHGSTASPLAKFRGNICGARIKNLNIDTLRTEVVYQNQSFISPLTVVKGKKFTIYTDFVVLAKFSINPFMVEFIKQKNIHAELTVVHIDASIVTDLIGGEVYPESGSLTGNLILSGSITSPELAGKMVLKTGGVYIETFGKEYRGVFVSMLFRDKKVEIPDIRIEASNGYLKGSGSVQLTGFKPESLQLSFHLYKFPFEKGDIFEGIFDGSLEVSGAFPDNILVAGDLYVEEGYAYLSFGKSGGSGRMRPNPLRLNIRIRADRRIFLVNELADMEFSTDLTIVKQDPVTVLISGKLDVIKGTFLYLDRIFIIQEGSIIFNNEPEINPTLNLQGETVINDTIFIDLHVTGSLKTPGIQLTSNPPLPEEDIISLLSFGKLLSEAPLTIRDISLMKSRALNLAEGLISKELQKRLRINELELRTGLAGENPRVTVGLYLSPRVYFKYAHSFEVLEKDVYQVKYFIKRNMAIYGERDKEGEISIGIEARYRF